MVRGLINGIFSHWPRKCEMRYWPTELQEAVLVLQDGVKERNGWRAVVGGGLLRRCRSCDKRSGRLPFQVGLVLAGKRLPKFKSRGTFKASSWDLHRT